MTDIAIKDITVGESWACRFRVHTFVTEDNKPVDTRDLSVGETVKDGAPGYYEGTGVIQTRDCQKKLVELWDTELERTWIVGWDDCWDIDHVEWSE